MGFQLPKYQLVHTGASPALDPTGEFRGQWEDDRLLAAGIGSLDARWSAGSASRSVAIGGDFSRLLFRCSPYNLRKIVGLQLLQLITDGCVNILKPRTTGEDWWIKFMFFKFWRRIPPWKCDMEVWFFRWSAGSGYGWPADSDQCSGWAQGRWTTTTPETNATTVDGSKIPKPTTVWMYQTL